MISQWKQTGVLLLCLVIHTITLCQGNSVQLPGGVTERDNSHDASIDKTSVLLPGENIDKKIKDNIFVRVTASKSTCFVGEPVLVVYKLYTRLRSQSKVINQPVFTGCSVYEMTTDELFPQNELYNGKIYKTYIVRKVQLVPLQEGPMKLDMASVDNNISFFNSNNDMYDNMPSVKKNILLTSQPFVVNVRSLPEKGKPKDFSNAIGRFKVSAKAVKSTDTANDNNNLEIIIEGNGNFKGIETPIVNWPANIEHFEASANESIDKLSFPENGTKTISIPFVVRQAGSFIIPPVSFSYFDADKQQYIMVQTDSVPLKILPATNKFGIDTSRMSEDVTNHKYIWIVPAIALIAGFAWWWNYGRKKPQEAKDTGMATTTPMQAIINTPVAIAPETLRLEEAINELLLVEGYSAFYTEAKQLATALLKQEKDADKKKVLTQIVQQCDAILYAADSSISKEDILRQLEVLSANDPSTGTS